LVNQIPIVCIYKLRYFYSTEIEKQLLQANLEQLQIMAEHIISMKLDALKWHPYLSDNLKEPIKEWTEEAKVKVGEIKGNQAVKVSIAYNT
jgi:hypothetical protein